MEAAQESQDKRILLSCGWGYFIFRVNKARFVPTALWHDLSPVEWLQRRWEGNLHMNPATWLASRGLSDAAGPWDTRLVGGGIDDGEYFSRVISASLGIQFVAEAKVFYRITGGSRLSYIGRSDKKMESQLSLACDCRSTICGRLTTATGVAPPASNTSRHGFTIFTQTGLTSCRR